MRRIGLILLVLLSLPILLHVYQPAWQGEFMQKLREAHLKNMYEKHKFCGQCPDWKQTRWPGEGRSYADMMEEFKEEAAV